MKNLSSSVHTLELGENIYRDKGEPKTARAVLEKLATPLDEAEREKRAVEQKIMRRNRDIFTCSAHMSSGAMTVPENSPERFVALNT